MKKDVTVMELNLGQVDERETYTFSDRFLIQAHDGTAVACDAGVTADVVKTGSRLLLEATVTCGVHVRCGRCLEEFVLPMETSFNLVFHRGHSADVPPGDEEEFVILTDVEESRYDIFPHVRENIILEMPMKVLCSKDCKGLCSRCGADLNKGECGCDSSERDPRWDPLKNVLNKEKDN